MEVGLTGYLAMGDSINNWYKAADSSSAGYDLLLMERKNEFYYPAGLQIHVLMGSAMYTMKPLPKDFSDEDVEITVQDSIVIHTGDRIGIRGTLFNRGSGRPTMMVTMIGKLPDDTLDYARLKSVELPNPVPDSLTGQLVRATGQLELPDSMLTNYFSRFALHITGRPSPALVDLYYGKGPGRVEPVEGEYSDKDIKIYDDSGKRIPFSKPVIVYGTWSGTSIKVESIRSNP